MPVNRYENTRCSQMIYRMIDDMDIDIKALSDAVGVSNTNMWFYFHGKRKWNLETWLDTLACLGILRTRENCIIIDIPPSSDERLHFKRLRKQKSKFIRPPGEKDMNEYLNKFNGRSESG